MSESTRFFKKIIPSLRASTQEILTHQRTQAQRVEVPVCGGVTCWWHAADCAATTAALTAQCQHGAHAQDAQLQVQGASLPQPQPPLQQGTQQQRSRAPVIFELHGGGFVLGDARKDDAFCAALRDKTGAHVVAINYPKAPEYAYPTAPNAVWETLVWFAQNAAEYHIDAHRFAVLGFSSGGNLAAVMALRAAAQPDAPFCMKAQVLHYPFLDAATPPAQKSPHPWDLSAEVMDAFTELYCAGTDPQNSMISPVYATPSQLRGVAPALVMTAQRDALQAEGEQYARLLQAAEVQTSLTVQPYAHHGYVEDWFNAACYEATPEDTRALHEAQFGISAQQALDESARFLCDCFLL